MKKNYPARVRFSRMREEDLPEVMAIERASFPCPWTEKMFLTGFKNSQTYLLVVRGEPGILGYGEVSFALPEAHLGNLVVQADYRGRKLGEKLLKKIIGLAKKAGAEKMHLEVRAGNTPAQSLYKKFGFCFTGVRKGYYQKEREDAFLFSLDL